MGRSECGPESRTVNTLMGRLAPANRLRFLPDLR